MAEVDPAFVGALVGLPRCSCSLCAGPSRLATEAEAKARELLESFLDDRQRYDLKQTGCFVVVGSDGVRYRLNCSEYSGNVFAVTNGRALRQFCCYPRGRMPLSDRILGQLLALKTEAQRFRAVAHG